MIPFEPEKLEVLRARLPQALSVVYDYEIIELGGQRPGEQRQHVFDFEDGIRCILSIDEGQQTPRHLHLSYSLQDWHTMNVGQFLRRIEAIPGELWPDLILPLIARFQTPRALHYAFEFPPQFTRFLKVCDDTPKTAPSVR